MRSVMQLVLPLAIGTTAGASLGDDLAPFTSEAAARGLVYPIQNYPPPNGYYGFGCALGDLDGDGDLDAVIVGRLDGQLGVFENVGGGVFADRSLSCGIPPMQQPSAPVLADYDGDGDLDLFVTATGFKPSMLFRNEGGLEFADVTGPSGIVCQRVAKGCAWGDYDGDGWVDLYVCAYVTPSDPFAKNELWHNNGDGTFLNVAEAVGVASIGASLQCVWTDVDRDGDLDLYVSNDRGFYPGFPPNQLFLNEGGVFTDVGPQSGTNVALFSMGLACGDFSGDGLVDFYCTNIPQPVRPLKGQFPLLLSKGQLAWVQAQQEWGVANPTATWGWGASFFDWNNDGDLDLYVNDQFGANSLFDQGPEPPATNVAGLVSVTGNNSASYCTVVGDVDLDGDLDVILNNLNGPTALYINHEGEKRSWVALRVVGDGPNTAAIGANAEIAAAGKMQYAEIYAGGNSYLGANDLTLHFGLDDVTMVDSATVKWPSNGPSRTLTSMPADVRWTIYPPSKLGDANLDGVIDFSDRAAICAARGPVTPGVEMLDLNGDFAIDSVDVAAFKLAYSDPWSDLDGNGSVSGSDLAILLGAWGSDACLADLDLNGTVGGSDLATLLGAWQP